MVDAANAAEQNSADAQVGHELTRRVKAQTHFAQSVTRVALANVHQGLEPILQHMPWTGKSCRAALTGITASLALERRTRTHVNRYVATFLESNTHLPSPAIVDTA